MTTWLYWTLPFSHCLPGLPLPSPQLFLPFARPLSPVDREARTQSLLLLSPLRQCYRPPNVILHPHWTSYEASCTVKRWMTILVGSIESLRLNTCETSSYSPRRTTEFLFPSRPLQHLGTRRCGLYFMGRSQVSTRISTFIY